MALELTAAGFIEKLEILNAGPHVALAVSGGGDSMGMLALAAAAKDLPTAPAFSVLTVNHGLRPEAADEAEAVAAQCRKAGLVHHILSADKALAPTDIQQQARAMRYRLMGAWCTQADTPLVLAHHQGDQAETVLMRLARGSGVDGLAAMAETRNMSMPTGTLRLIRPFLNATSEDLRAIARAADMPIAEDPSNQNRDYERVRWRQLMPELADMGIDAPRLAALARTMQNTRDTLNRRLHDWLDDAADWHEYGVLCLPRKAFLGLPTEYQARLLSHYVRYFGGLAHPKKRQQIRRLYEAVAAQNHGGLTLGGIALRWRQDMVFLGREAAACPRGVFVGDRFEWDRRFAFQANASRPTEIGPLGDAGVQAARDAGQVFDDRVPAVYRAALPAVFTEGRQPACAIFDGNGGFQTYHVAEQAFTRDIFV